MGKTLLLRALRSLLSALVGYYATRYAKDPRFLALTPALQVGGKFLRSKYPQLAPWLPF